MKVVRTAALIVGAVALAATGVGAIGSLALAGTVTSVAGVSMATWGAIGTAASVVGSLTASRPSSSVQGSPTEFRADPQAFVPYAVGRTWFTGAIVHRAHFGPEIADAKNPYQGFTIVWSGGGAIEGIEAFKVDRTTQMSFDANGAAIGSQWQGKHGPHMWLRTQLGATPSPAIASPVSGFPGWGAQSQLSGFAAGVWVLRFDSSGKKFAAGTPLPGAILRGAKVYDPRLDSTYPGGQGACRALNEATYVWSENPWLHGLTWALGRWQNGKRVLGIGMPVPAIDVAAFVEAANVADANGWKVGGVVSSGDDKWNVLKLMAQAGGGEPIRLGAKLSCMVRAPRVSLATITSKDIVGAASVVATQPRRDRINGAVARIRLESHGWEVVPLAAVRPSTYLEEDGEERTREFDYPLVQDKDQAVELAYYDVADSREFGPVSLPLKTLFMGYKPGDCLTLNIPELGLNGQTALAISRGLNPGDGVVTIDFKSETDGKHAAALGLVGTAPPTPSLTPPDLADLPAPEGVNWTLTGGVFASEAGSTPALVVVGVSDSPNAEAVLFEYREEGAADWSIAGTEAPTVTRKEITSVTPGTSYEVAVSYVRRGIVGERLILGPVDVGAPVAGDTINVGGVPAPIVRDTLLELVDATDASELLERAGALLSRVRSSQATLLSMQLLQEKRLTLMGRLTHLDGIPLGTVARDEIAIRENMVETLSLIGARTEDGTAFILSTQTVKVSPTETLAERFTAISADFGGVADELATKATYTALNEAVAGEASARATAISDLNAAVTGQLALKAGITYVDSVVADATQAAATALSQVQSSLQSDIDTRATTSQLASATSTLEGSIATLSSNLTATFNGALATKASATDLTSAVAGLTGAIATTRQEIEAQFATDLGTLNTNLTGALAGKASLTFVGEAIATSEQAQAQALSQVQSSLQGAINGKVSITDFDSALVTLNGAIASASTTLSAQFTADLSAAVGGLQTQIDGKATVAQVDTAVANATSGLASSLSTVQATVGSHTSSIQSLEEVVVTPAGGLAKAMTLIDVDGYVSGTVQTNDGAVSAYKLRADLVEFRTPAGELIFTYDPIADVVRMEDVEVDTIKVGAVGSAQLQPSSVAQTFFAVTSQVITIPYGSAPTYPGGGGNPGGGGGGGGTLNPEVQAQN